MTSNIHQRTSETFEHAGTLKSYRPITFCLLILLRTI